MTILSHKEFNTKRRENLKKSDDEARYQEFLSDLESKLVRATETSEDDIQIKFWNDYLVGHEAYDQLQIFDAKDIYLNSLYSSEVLRLLRSKGYSYTRVAPTPFFGNIGTYIIHL